MKLKIKTLTPIHIGTGKELSPLEFFNNYRINYDKLFDLIAEEKKDDFFNWIDQIQDARFSVNDIQKKFGIKSNDITSKCGLYKFNQSFQDKVREGIKDSSNKLFIPGSSIKGSIRTALMYKVLKNPFYNSIIKNSIESLISKANNLKGQTRKIKNLLKSADDELQNEVFICGVEKEKKDGRNEIRYDDQKYDLLKLIRISDSESVATDTNGEICELQVYALKKEKAHKTFKKLSNKLENLKADSDNELIKEVLICGVLKEKNSKIEIKYDDQKYDLLKLIRISDSQSISTDTNGEICELQVYALKKEKAHKPFKVYTESIAEHSELEFDISIDVDFLKQAKIELNKSNTDFGKKYFIAIDRKLKNLFDIDIKNDSEFDEEKIIKTILEALNNFGESVSILESEWVKSIKNNTSFSSLEKLYKIENKFKIGFDSGFIGMTILPLLLTDNDLKQKAFEFYKAVGIGFHRSSNTPLNINEFPFTRKYSHNQTILGGFGWVTILNNYTKEKENETTTTNLKAKAPSKPANSFLAEITDDQTKPPIIKILEGDDKDKNTIMPGVNLSGLDLRIGSKVYVVLHKNRKGQIEKAEFKAKAQ